MENHYIAAMQRALVLAAQGQGRTGSNPVVGCVITNSEGSIIAEGFHTGGDHAEIVALKSLAHIPEGATIVVTLEPCNHVGKTGPCTEAIIDAGIKRVVFAVADPNPIAAGGFKRLKAAGVEVVAGVLETESRFVNRAWLHVIEKRRPLFIWKIASTLDGKTAAQDGTSKWITGESSRDYVSELRRVSDAVLVGTGTVIADNPELVPHDKSGLPNPLRVIVGERDIAANSRAMDERALTFHHRSHDLTVLCTELLARGVKQVLVESGSVLGTAMVQAGLIDEIILIQAPTLLGAGQSFIGDLGITTLNDRLDLEVIAYSQIGSDLMTHLKVGR